MQLLPASDDAILTPMQCPTSLRILSGGADKMLKLWTCTEPPNRSQYKIWTCTAIFTGHSMPLISVVWHPDGTVAASSGGGGVRLWAIPPPPFKHKAGVSNESFRRIESNGTSSSMDPLSASAPLPHASDLPRHDGLVNCLCFSPTGSLLATPSYDKTIRVWDAESGKVLKVLKGHSGAVLDVAWSNCSSRLASAGADEVIRIWNVATGYEIAVLQGHSNWVRCLSFSNPAQQSQIVSGSDSGELKIWNVSKVIRAENQNLHAGTILSIADLEGHTGGILASIWSPDNSKIASCSEDYCIRLWDVKTMKKLFLLDHHTAAVTSLAFSPNGQLLASGGEDKVVRLWSPISGKMLCEFGKGQIFGPVTRVGFSLDGLCLGGASVDKVFRVWSTRSLTEVASFPSTNDGIWALPSHWAVGNKASSSTHPGLLLTFSSDLGILRIMESSFEDIASIFFQFSAREVAFNGRVAACSVMGTDSVSLYHLLNLPATAPERTKRSSLLGVGGLQVDVATAARGPTSPTRSPTDNGRSRSPDRLSTQRVHVAKARSPSPHQERKISPTSPLSQKSPMKKRGFR